MMHEQLTFVNLGVPAIFFDASQNELSFRFRQECLLGDHSRDRSL